MLDETSDMREGAGWSPPRFVPADGTRDLHGDLFDLGQLVARPRSENEAAIRALCFNAYLGGGRALARVLGRYKMFVDTGDVGHSTHLLLDGYWEMWTTMALAAAVRPGMTCVDIGANLGYFSLLMADLVGPGGFVHAFEPNPPIAARLRDTLAVNGFGARACVHQVALGDREGAAMGLVVPEHEPQNAHVVAGLGRGRMPLITRRLDGYPELAKIDLIKIDAETSEEAIWRGMSGVLETSWPMTIFLEFTAARFADPDAFLRRVTASGFAFSRIDPCSGAAPVSQGTVLRGSEADEQMLVLVR